MQQIATATIALLLINRKEVEEEVGRQEQERVLLLEVVNGCGHTLFSVVAGRKLYPLHTIRLIVPICLFPHKFHYCRQAVFISQLSSISQLLKESVLQCYKFLLRVEDIFRKSHCVDAWLFTRGTHFIIEDEQIFMLMDLVNLFPFDLMLFARFKGKAQRTFQSPGNFQTKSAMSKNRVLSVSVPAV